MVTKKNAAIAAKSTKTTDVKVKSCLSKNYILNKLNYQKLPLPNGGSILSGVFMLTPEYAREICESSLLKEEEVLSFKNEDGTMFSLKNRKQSKQFIERYKLEMEGGHWKFTGDTICFTRELICLNGYHRLKALSSCKPGTVVPFAILIGIDPETYFSMDRGNNRSSVDYMVLDGIKNPALTRSAIIKLKSLLESNGTTVRVYHNDNLNYDSIKELLAENSGFTDLVSFEWEVKRVKNGGVVEKQRHFPDGWVAASIQYLKNKGVDPEKVKEFWTQFYCAHGWLNSANTFMLNKFSNSEKFKFLCIFMNAYLNGEEVSRFHIDENKEYSL